MAHELGLAKSPPAEQRSIKTLRGYMTAYKETIPGTDVTFSMVPIPGGEFLFGSPVDEEGRSEDEGPQIKVIVEPMWVGKYEVTWAEYHLFMQLYEPFKKLKELRYYTSTAEEGSKLAKRLAEYPALKGYLSGSSGIDAVTCPTPLYDPSFTYEPGEAPDLPAVTMTQFGAKQYTKWLSNILESEYRLPTEAEWEYAARAGTTGAYSSERSELSEFAWFIDNSDDQTHPVGSKRANPWGLYDIHGNAAEWVLDEYDAKHYESLDKETTASASVRWPKKLYPRAIRGGCWYDESDRLRSAARYYSDDEEWTLSDPNLPISPWWYTEYESQGVGFRIVRPLEPMDDTMKQKVWEADVETLRMDVQDRLAEGRGVESPANASLPKALEELAGASEHLEEAIEY